MTTELEIDSGLPGAPAVVSSDWLAIRNANRMELKAVNKEIATVKKQLHELAEKAELLRVRIRASEERENGKRDDDKRMAEINQTTKAAATLHWSKWSEVDDSYLVENLDKMTYRELAKQLGRTLRSIRSRVATLKMANAKAHPTAAKASVDGTENL